MSFKEQPTSIPAVLAAVLGALAVGQTTTSAAMVSETRSVHVNYADLDLSKRAGAETLYHRINAAAKEVCQANSPDRVFLAVQVAVLKCLHEAIGNAISQVGAPELIAIYNERNRAPLASLTARNAR